MPKVTANGKTFNFPDGTSNQEMGEAIDNYFKTAPTPAEPQAVDPVRQELASKIKPEVQVPKGIKMPFGMTESDIKQANRGRADYNKVVESLLTDPNALAAYKQAQTEGTGSAIAGAAGHELKSMGAGISELIDQYLPAGVSNILNYQIGGENLGSPEARQEQRAIDMAKENMAAGARSVASPVASTVGSAIPYLATDVALSPVTNAILGNVGKGITRVGKGALRGSEALETALKSGTSTASRQAGELVEPLSRGMRNIANRPVMNEELAASYKELARAPLTGAIEGGMNYDMSAGEGAAQSTLGQLTAMGPLKALLGRTPVKLSKSEQQTLKTMQDRGYRATPGMRTGSKVLQAKEQGFRSEPRFRDYMDEFDTANRKVISDYASEAMGLPPQTSADLTPEILSGHMADLSSQYKQLEANTTGRFGAKQSQEIGKVMKDLQPTKNRNTSPADAQRYSVVQSYVNEMRSAIQSPQRGQGGKFAQYNFDGAQYQGLRQRLQDDISQAYANGDNRLGSSLRKIQKTLDDSLTAGMDKATAKEWKDLNERYAMTRLVMENGMDPLGGIDTGKLTGKLMSGDETIRTLTSKGGRIKKLQDIAKIDAMQKRQAGAEGWSGSGVEQGDTAKQGLLKSTFSTPLITRIPMSTRAGMNMYMSGYPSVTGLTGLSRPAIGKISRAQEQGSQNISELGRKAEELYGNSAEQLQRLLERLGVQ